MLILLVVGSYSCTEEIDLDLNNEKNRKLVVEGEITSGSGPYRVNLTWSTDFFDSELIPPVTGADVLINGGGDSYPLWEVSPGKYETSPMARGIEGEEYELLVNYKGYNTKSISTIPQKVELDSITVESHNISKKGPHYDVRLWFQEPAGIRNFYQWEIYINGRHVNDSIYELAITDDLFFDGMYVRGVFLDYIYANTGDVVEVRQKSMTKEIYDIYLAIYLQTEFRGGIFDTPAANIPTNMDNGGMGMFSTSAVSSKKVIIH